MAVHSGTRSLKIAPSCTTNVAHLTFATTTLWLRRSMPGLQSSHQPIPSRHKHVTTAPAMIIPERMDRKAYLNLNPIEEGCYRSRPGAGYRKGNGYEEHQANPLVLCNGAAPPPGAFKCPVDHLLPQFHMACYPVQGTPEEQEDGYWQ